MINKKLLILAIFLVSLFAISAVSAADAAITSEDTDQIGLSSNNDITEDNLQTSEENSILIQTNDDETLSAKTDSQTLSEGECTYYDLIDEIGNGGNKSLTKSYYIYDGGDTIEITTSGMINGNGAVIDMAGSTIQAFKVTASGVTIKNLTIKNANFNGDGGAIFFSSSFCTVENCNFINNYARYGGAIYLARTSNMMIFNCSFMNSASKSSGGAIGMANAPNTMISNCSFVNNYAGYSAGAIYSTNCDNAWFSNSSFVKNNAIYDGGAIYFESMAEHDSINWKISNCSFIDNEATYFNGGAVYISGSYGNLSNSYFVNNTADLFGGAIYCRSKNGCISNCSFMNNSVSSIHSNSHGGAIWWETQENGAVSTCVFVHNSGRNGGAIGWSGSNGCISECVLMNNSASNGIIYFRNSEDYVKTLNINNNIILNNNALAIVYAKSDSTANSDYNWFGHNVTDYKNNPNLPNCESWLFLDASSVPIAGVNSKSTVTFTLDNLYDSSSKNISHPDISDLPDVVFRLSAVNGYLNKYTVRPGESVIFTTNGHGDGIVRAKYGNVSYSIPIVNLKVDTNLTASDVVAEYHSGTRLLATLMGADGNPLGNEMVSFTVNGRTWQFATNANGVVRFSTDRFDVGNYSVLISFGGNGLYAPSNTTANIIIHDSTVLTAADVIAEYHSGTRMVATLKDSNGNALGNEMVSFSVNGKKWEFATNANGVVRFSTDRFGVGNYSVLISYEGNELYHPSNTTANILIYDSTVLTASDVNVEYHSGTRLVATLKDGNGNALSNEMVSFTVNGKMWEFATNANGVVRFSTDRFGVGNYSVLISYEGNELYHPSNTTANILIYDSTVLTASDVNAKYHSGTRLVATLKDGNGNALSNEKVSFTVNGKKWEFATNANGVVRFSTDRFGVGNYTVIISYAGNELYHASNTTANIIIHDSTVLTAADVNVEYHSGTRLVATLKDGNGNALSNEMVSFTVNGKMWEFATNANGVVRFSTDRFDVGNYTVIISYAGNELYHPSNTTANIIIHDSTVLTASDVIASYHSGTRLVATLRDSNGNALSNEKVSFTVNGKKWEFTTNANGIVRFSTDRFGVGNYTVFISYAGNELYHPSNTTANIIIYDKLGTVLTGTKVITVYGSDAEFVATLKDVNDNPISGADVHLILLKSGTAAVNTTLTTDDNGKASFAVGDLDPAVYYATVSYDGDDSHNSTVAEHIKVYVQKISTTLTVDPDYWRSDAMMDEYRATLTDANNQPVRDAEISLSFLDYKNTLTTDANGEVVFDMSDMLYLGYGTYTAEFEYKATTYYYASNKTATVLLYNPYHYEPGYDD